jgi:predicted nucleic acid-binding protein
MILIDTSIWIDHLRGRDAALITHVNDLLAGDRVLGHPFVYGELLMGDDRNHADFFTTYEHLPQGTIVPHGELVAFVRERHLARRGVNWIDVHLLAATLVRHARLWTADGPLQQAASGLGIGYQIG